MFLHKNIVSILVFIITSSAKSTTQVISARISLQRYSIKVHTSKENGCKNEKFNLLNNNHMVKSEVQK